jgi:alkylhydroperoxidase family enzyme
VGSGNGLSREQLEAVSQTEPFADGLFDDRTLACLAYADAMTIGDVSDADFAQVQLHLTPEEIVELTAVIAWENASARFNRALRVESQGLWS